jgi:membrane protease YdiL (CAAX protease family)
MDRMQAIGDGQRLRLAAEFAALFLVAPVVMALAMPPAAMFPALFALTAVAIGLLAATPGFTWRSLAAGRLRGGEALVFAAGVAAVSAAAVALTAPGQGFGLVRADPALLAAVLVIYPLLSVLPQELVYRVLYFRRYGAILPAGTVGIVLNAAVFALAHLFFWDWIVAVMTFAGGLVFAWAYVRQGSFPQAVLLHSVAGSIVFVSGLGNFFYTGNIKQPF